MTEDSLQYHTMIDAAMRGVVRTSLLAVQRDGLPGDHHFYISFLTTFPGVKISEQLKSRYPKEITIVLQHQFWDFKVEDSFFTVTLSFGGMPEKLVVPYAALTAFADPSVKFGLQFQPAEDHEVALIAAEPLLALETETKAQGDVGAEIISLDAFRKK